jgi:hypothetical protein
VAPAVAVAEPPPPPPKCTPEAQVSPQLKAFTCVSFRQYANGTRNYESKLTVTNTTDSVVSYWGRADLLYEEQLIGQPCVQDIPSHTSTYCGTAKVLPSALGVHSVSRGHVEWGGGSIDLYSPSY